MEKVRFMTIGRKTSKELEKYYDNQFYESPIASMKSMVDSLCKHSKL